MPEFDLEIFILGLIGGVLIDLGRLLKNRYRQPVLRRLGSPTVWQSMAVLGLIGGFVAWLLDSSTAIASLTAGYTAPDFISSLASKDASSSGVRRAPNSSFNNLLEWWHK